MVTCNMLKRFNPITPEERQQILLAVLGGEHPGYIAMRFKISAAASLRIALEQYGKPLPGREPRAKLDVGDICSVCGDPKQFPGRCMECNRAYRREYQRAHRPRHSELSEEARWKANVRTHANVAQRRGQLVPESCEQCRSPDAEKHHDDYTRPLDVRWLCRPCHLALHHPEATP